jgi:photosystem II stability/assembly factor-like uncharacterized protein
MHMGRMLGNTLAAVLFLMTMSASRGIAQDKPDMAAACASPEQGMALRRACQTFLEKGEFPADARLRALEDLRVFKSRAAADPTAKWVSIGPAPIVGGSPETTWTARPRSGRVAAIAVDPSNKKHWLIGAAGGGVWETFDGGQSWAPRTDAQPVLTMGAIAFAPSAPKIVYAGTGEAVFSVDAYGGQGVLKSTDGGTTWAHLANTGPAFLNKAFSDLAVHPTSPDIVIAGVTKALQWSPTTSAPDSGIYKTVNGGSLWGLKLKGEATDLEIDPNDFNRQYAALGNNIGALDNGVYRSTNAGDTWQLVAGPWTGGTRVVGRVELAIAPSNPSVLYVSIHDATPLPPPSTSRHNGIIGLWKTTNAWAATPTWQQIPLGPTDDGTGTFGYCGWNPFPEPRAVAQCFYNHELSVDPKNENVLYAGGIGLWRYDGATWKEVALSDPAKGIHADQHSMAWAGKQLIVGNDGGVWSTKNGGKCWRDHNAGLGTIQFWGGALAPTPGLLALGGTQDNGTAVWEPTATTWKGVIRGDAGPAVISPTLPQTHWAIAGQSKGLEIWRTLNAGTTLALAGDNLPDAVRRSGTIARPFVSCPVNHDVVLFADKALWKTTNLFASHPGQPAWTSNSAEVVDRITAVAFAASDATCQTYAIGRKGSLQMTTAGGTPWRDLDPNNTLPQQKVPKSLAFDPQTPGTLYVVYSKFASEPGRVFRTANALATVPTWTNVSPPADLPHNSIALDPVDPRIVWVGTDLGVWRGIWNDGSANMSWTHYGPESGLPNVMVHDVKVHAASRQPVAFTHGRGAFLLVNAGAWCAGSWGPTLGTNFGGCPR